MYRCDKIPFSHHSPVSCELLNYMLLQYSDNFKHYIKNLLRFVMLIQSGSKITLYRLIHSHVVSNIRQRKIMIQ